MRVVFGVGEQFLEGLAFVLPRGGFGDAEEADNLPTDSLGISPSCG
jgi:hypothetical protein